MSFDRNHQPKNNYACQAYPPARTRYRFLNTGAVAGTARELGKLLRSLLELREVIPPRCVIDDQGLVNHAFLYMHGQTRRRHRAVACLRCPGTASAFAMPRSSTPAPSERRQRARPCPAPPRAASTQQGNTTVGGSIHSAQGTNQPGPSLQQRNTRNPGSHRRLYIQRSRLHRQHTCKVSAMLFSCTAASRGKIIYLSS